MTVEYPIPQSFFRRARSARRTYVLRALPLVELIETEQRIADADQTGEPYHRRLIEVVRVLIGDTAERLREDQLTAILDAHARANYPKRMETAPAEPPSPTAPSSADSSPGTDSAASTSSA